MIVSEDQAQTIRLDQWLWFARFFKSRTLARAAIEQGHIRVNDRLRSKPSFLVTPGDRVVITKGKHTCTVVVVHKGLRRGPATEAQTLFDDISHIGETPEMTAKARVQFNASTRPKGSGRPTKRQRRAIDRLTRVP